MLGLPLTFAPFGKFSTSRSEKSIHLENISRGIATSNV